MIVRNLLSTLSRLGSRSTSSRPALALAVVTTGSLLLTGCFKMETAVSVQPDGSADMSYTIAIDSGTFMQLAAFSDDEEAAGMTKEEICAEFGAEMTATPEEIPPGATIAPYEEGPYCGFTATMSVPASDDPGAMINAATEEAGDTDLGELTLQRTDDGGWLFTIDSLDEMVDTVGAATMTEGAATEAAGDSAAGGTSDEMLDEEMLDNLAMMMMSSMVISYRVELPGDAVEGANNADSVEAINGSTRFEWQLDLAATPDAITARTGPGTGEAAEGQSSDAALQSSEADTLASESVDAELDSTASSEPGSDQAEAGATSDDAGDDGSDPQALGFTTDETEGGGSSGLLLGLAALLAMLGLGGWFMISRADAGTEPI